MGHFLLTQGQWWRLLRAVRSKQLWLTRCWCDWATIFVSFLPPNLLSCFCFHRDAIVASWLRAAHHDDYDWFKQIQTSGKSFSPYSRMRTCEARRSTVEQTSLRETWLTCGLPHWMLRFLYINSFVSSMSETRSRKHTHKSRCWVLNQSGPTVPLRTRQPQSKAACPRCWETTVLPAAGVGMEVEMPCTRPRLPRQMTKNVFSLTKEVWHTLRRSAAKPAVRE